MSKKSNQVDSPKKGFNLIYQEVVQVRKLLQTMCDQIDTLIAIHNKGNKESAEDEAPIDEKPPNPITTELREIPWERLKGIIDQIGGNIAKDPNTTIDQKMEAWLETLKWALPLIPAEDHDKKELLINCIENPSQSDFMQKQP